MTSDSSPNNPPQPRGGLSLYANLLDPNAASSGATISRAPVSFTQNRQLGDQQDDSATTAAKKQQQLSAAALRFQPTKRPQLAAQKSNKPKSTFVKPPIAIASVSTNTSNAENSQAGLGAGSSVATALPAFKSRLADWAANEDEDDYYTGAEKRQRGGRKKRKKNKDRDEAAAIQNWDDIYDPSRPNIYEDYKHSEEKYREIREWKDRLYAHRMRSSQARYSSEEYESDQMSEDARPSRQFAPPPPPSAFDREQSTDHVRSPPPLLPALDVSSDVTGEDAYARRIRMSQAASNDVEATHLAVTTTGPEPANPSVPSSTISRAPVRYSLPSAPADIPATEAELEAAFEAEAAAAHGDRDGEEEGDSGGGGHGRTNEEDAGTEERSLRPGQKGFAARLMSKYGWTKGSGLGAAGTGIVNPLRVQVEKRKKKSDAEGGGFVGGPAAKGKIIGSKVGKGTSSSSASGEAGSDTAAAADDKNDFSNLSNVVVLRGMLDNIDVEQELHADGSIMQEIGDECAGKYGRVERVFIHRGDEAVFVKFTSPLSALRAVQALQGRMFNGNIISAGYWDADKFEEGIYS